MKVEILSFGSELTSGARLNTHLQYLGRRLEEIGFSVGRGSCIPDDLGLIRESFIEALGRANLILATGGLGPTEDDLTRQGLSQALDLPLVEDRNQYRIIKLKIAKKYKKHMSVLRVQASAPRGASFLPNRTGSAPGIYLPWRGRVICVLPGPPEELKPMFEELLPRILRDLPGLPASASAIVRTWGLREAEIQESIGGLFTVRGPLRVVMTIYEGGVDLRIRGTGMIASEVRRAVRTRAERIARSLGRGVYSRSEDELEAVVGKALVKKGQTLAVAESCTGGLLGEMITRVPGSSAWFVGGLIAYSNRIKVEQLQISNSKLQEYGAVSEETAKAMAEGVRGRLNADYGVSITGVAGPDGGTKEKPVGLVYVAVAGPGGKAQCRAHRFKWDRRTNRTLASRAALDLLRRTLSSHPLNRARVLSKRARFSP